MALSDFGMRHVCTHNYMADGSVIVDEVGQPLRKIEAGAVATLQSHGPAQWNPPMRDLTASEAARWFEIQSQPRGG